MRYKVQNIGKIENVDVAIDGITVLTGPNDTGKSTVGKILYTVFSSMYHVDQLILTAKRSNIQKVASDFLRENMEMSPGQRHMMAIQMMREIVDCFQAEEPDTASLIPAWKERLSEETFRLSGEDFDSELQQVLAKAEKSWKVPDEEVRQRNFNLTFVDEFGTSAVFPLSGDENSEVEIDIKNSRIFLKRNENDFLHIEEGLDLVKSISYIDDPFIIDQLDFGYRLPETDMDHRRNLRHKLINMPSEELSVEELLTRKTLDTVMDRLNQVCSGDIVQTEGRYFQYQSDELKKPIPVKDISTGMKSFLILKELLLNGQLEENGIVVLDEPEVHLHPSWQIAFAGIIVELQKAFHLNFLITTHSVEFLTAIEYYSKKSEIEARCHYYYLDTNRETGMSVSVETSDHLDRIYKNLSTPYLDLLEKMDGE